MFSVRCSSALRFGSPLSDQRAHLLPGSRREPHGTMSRQYNMYNVQLSEFWKQRCTKEGIHNAPYLFDEENDDTVSEAPSRAVSQLSTTSTVTQQKIEELQKKLESERQYAAPTLPCAKARAPPFQHFFFFSAPLLPREAGPGE